LQVRQLSVEPDQNGSMRRTPVGTKSASVWNISTLQNQ
jgi:hypothetical protein